MNRHLSQIVFSANMSKIYFRKSHTLASVLQRNHLSFSVLLRAGLLSALACALLSACGSMDSSTKLQSPDANTRMDAVLKAGNSGNENTVPEIVPALQSEDPLVRWAAQQSLEKLTGTTLGYGWSDSPSNRAAATQKWVAWCKNKNLSTPAAS
jgi:HEAT repeat protein